MREFKNELVFCVVVLASCCAQKPGVAPAPSASGNAFAGISDTCLSATRLLPDVCRTDLARACANIEGSTYVVPATGKTVPWLKPDYACLGQARGCDEAKACPELDVRP